MSRLEVRKTYKLFIGGKFPRTESGNYFPLKGAKGSLLANISKASVKDFREAVVAARSACSSWAGSTAFLRSQILYRAAEMLEGRREQFQNDLQKMGTTPKPAQKEVQESIDLLTHYAGWCDKYQQVFSSANPVSSAHFNFSIPEPLGVVAIAAPTGSGLLGLCASIAPVIAGGNTCVLLAAPELALCAITLAEVLNTSDMPAGTVNILTGNRNDLLAAMASHRDVNALLLFSDDPQEKKRVQTHAAEHIMRVTLLPPELPTPNPYLIADFQEIKTTWHPIGY